MEGRKGGKGVSILVPHADLELVTSLQYRPTLMSTSTSDFRLVRDVVCARLVVAPDICGGPHCQVRDAGGGPDISGDLHLRVWIFA